MSTELVMSRNVVCVCCVAVVLAVLAPESAAENTSGNSAVRDPTAPVGPPGNRDTADENSRIGQMMQMLGGGAADAAGVGGGLSSGLQAVSGQRTTAGTTGSDEESQADTAGLRMVIISSAREKAYAAAFLDNVWYRVGSGTRTRLLTEVTEHGARFESSGVRTYLRVVEHGVLKARLGSGPNDDKDDE